MVVVFVLVDDCFVECLLFGCFDYYVYFVFVEQCWVDEIVDGCWVVYWCVVDFVLFFVVGQFCFYDVCDDCVVVVVECVEWCDLCWCDWCFYCDVVWQYDDWYVVVEYDVGCLWIDVDVEFGGWCDVVVFEECVVYQYDVV